MKQVNISNICSLGKERNNVVELRWLDKILNLLFWIDGGPKNMHIIAENQIIFNKV